MARTAPITVELSAKDRQLIRELIAAIQVAHEDAPSAEGAVRRLIEQSRGGFAEAARAEGGKFVEAALGVDEKVMPLGMLPRSITDKMERDQQEFLDRMQQLGQTITSTSEPKTSLWNDAGAIYWGDEPEKE